MGTKIMSIVLSAIVMVILVPMETTGQSNCQTELVSLQACFSYISASSSIAPSSDCCNRVQSVYNTRAECLCSALNQPGLNRTRVLQLPNACNLHLPPSSLCNSLSGSPGARPPSPPPSAYSTKIRNSLMLSVLSAAACVGVFIKF